MRCDWDYDINLPLWCFLHGNPPPGPGWEGNLIGCGLVLAALVTFVLLSEAVKWWRGH